jgi:hypothetical protein
LAPLNISLGRIRSAIPQTICPEIESVIKTTKYPLPVMLALPLALTVHGEFTGGATDVANIPVPGRVVVCV